MATDSDEAGVRGGLRGRMDRLYKVRLDEAMALKRAIEIIDADDRQTAVAVAPKKFRKALNHRRVKKVLVKQQSARRPKADRLAAIVAYLTDHPGATTSEVTSALQMQAPSSVRYLIKQVARPLHKVKRKQPQDWVLK
jgi:hypothetical protein